MRLIAPATLLAAAVAVVMSVAPAQACACGIALEASVTRERALVIQKPGREEIVASFDLRSDGSGRAAVVLPVPGDPAVEAIESGDPLSYLDLATSPRPVAAAGGGDETAGAVPRGVDVIGREVVGGYDVSRLRAGDPAELGRWLESNGYAMPPGAQPIFDDYVREGWRYVAIKLAEGSEGRLKPLRVAFPSDRLVYPMRLTQLGTQPVNVTVYTLADDERKSEGLERQWRGRISELDPQPRAELRELLPADGYLTKLTAENAAPRDFVSDFNLGPVDSTPTHGVGSSAVDDSTYEWLLFLHVLAAFAVVGGAVFVSTAALGLRKAVEGETLALVRIGRLGLRTTDVSATLALILGIVLAAHLDEYGVFDGWIIGAYVLWVIAAALSGKLTAAYREAGEGGPSAALTTAQSLYLHAGFVVSILLLVIDMVYKPGA